VSSFSLGVIAGTSCAFAVVAVVLDGLAWLGLAFAAAAVVACEAECRREGRCHGANG